MPFKMRAACAFDGTEWRYYLSSEAKALNALVGAADEVITFNGKNFDELVLRRHYKLPARALAGKGKHVDLCAIIYEEHSAQGGLQF